MVTHALAESKQWLAVATKGTDPTPIKDFKAWAATVAEMTKQKGVASEIQADALEMLRRAERGIGQAVRNGQEAGEIGVKHETNYRPRHDALSQDIVRKSPREFVPNSDELSQTYAMTDDVSDEQFEEALIEAREEGNLSRANVVRKIKQAAGVNHQSSRRGLRAAEKSAKAVSVMMSTGRPSPSGEGVSTSRRSTSVTVSSDDLSSSAVNS